jgi:hypothetical protein
VTGVMWQIRRIRLDRIGAPAARFLGVMIDTADGDGHPLDSILWLRNGGGKSTVLSLVCAQVKPHRRDFLATAVTDKHLEDYVLGADTAHVTVEWSGPAGRRLVTGAVYEWTDRTQPADPTRDHDKLQARWYAFTPVTDRAELDLLPFTRDGVPLTLKEFIAAVRAWDIIPHCGAVVTDGQERWGRILDDHGLDPELFDAILQMNATEGGIESQFQFRNADAFVKYLLGLIVDPEDARKVSGILEEVRVGLAERPAIAADLTFADEAVPQLRQLVTARTEHLTATEMLTAAETAATELRVALVAAAQRASLDKDTQAEVARGEGERALAERRAGEYETSRSVELRRIAAAFRHVAAEKLQGELTDQQALAQAELEAWRAVPRLAGLTEVQRRVRSLQAQLDAVMIDAEPLRQARDAAAATFAAALDTRIATLTAERNAAGKHEQAAVTDAAAAKKRHTVSTGARGRAEERLESFTEALKALDSEVAAAVTAGYADTGEDLSAAISRHRADDTAASSRLDEVAAQRRELAGRRDALADRERHLGETRTRLTFERDALVTRRGALAARINDLASDERLRLLAETDDLDVLTEGADLLSLLGAQITRADRRRVEIAVEGAEDDRAAAALATTGLLPPALDIARALAECENAGIAVTSGWAYFADSVPPRLRAHVLTAAPALANGVLVHNPTDLPRARELLATASLRPTSAVTVASTSDLQAAVTAVTAGTASSVFVIPTAAALIDKTAAHDEIRLRELAHDDRAAEDNSLARQREVDEELRRSLRALLDECPSGTLENLHKLLDVYAIDLAAVDAELDGIPAQRAALDENDARLTADDGAAQQARRSAATAISVLTGLVTRFAAARPMRDEVQILPAQIKALTDVITEADKAEAAARADADTARADASSRQALITGVGAERTGLGADVVADLSRSVPVDDARAEWQSANAAYRRETSESSLAAALDEARRGLAAPAAEVAALSETTRLRAWDLFATPDGAEPQLTSAMIRTAEAGVMRLVREVTAADNEVAEAANEIEQYTPADRRRHAQLQEHEIPASREAALAAAEAADDRQREHLTEENLAQERASGADAASTRAGLRAEAMRTQAMLLGSTRDETVGPEVVPYAGLPDDASISVDALRSDLSGAQSLMDETSKTLGQISTKLALWANEARFLGVKQEVRSRFLITDAADELGPDAEALSEDLVVYAANLRGRLTELEEHKAVLVTAMTGMVRQGLRTIARAQSLSQLPASLGPWAGQRFLDVAPRASVSTSDEIMRDRCSRLVDTLTARGVEVPRGFDLLWQATSAVVGEGNWKARVLKPSTTFALDQVSVEKMRKWSGGEKVTISLLLFCMVAKLRAANRGRDLPGLGVLPLDNPLGKANYVVFLDLQRKVAAANGVQLLFLTGVGDMKAVGRFPNIIRMRNTVNGAREYVRLAERSLAEDAPAGIVAGTRVWRDDPALKLL